MAPRKSRTRKTADKMASYKEQARRGASQGSRASTPRKSPRRSSSKMLKERSKHQAEKMSTPSPSRSHKDLCTDMPCEDNGPVQGSSRVENEMIIPETPPPSPLPDGRKRAKMTRLEEEVIIPETSPRISLAQGRKRAYSTQRQEDPVAECDDRDEESPPPSKKRKTFQKTPRRDEEEPWDENGSEINSNGSSVTQNENDLNGQRSTEAIFAVGDRLRHDHDNDLSNMLYTSKAGDNEHRGVRTSSERFQTNRDWALGRARNGIARGVASCAQIQDEEHDLHLLTTSSQTLSRLFESFQNRIMVEIRELNAKHRSEMNDLKMSVSNTVMSEVKDPRGVIENMSAGNKTVPSGRSGTETSVTEWEKKLNKLTPKLDIIFNKEVLSHIASYNAPKKVVDIYEKIIGSDTKRLSTSVQSLLFSLQPKDTKNNLVEGNGRLHSEFRFAVVNNVFFNVCHDNFGIFSTDCSNSSGKAHGMSTNKLGECTIKLPSWLEAEFVTTAYISGARSVIEGVNQSRKILVRDIPSPDDIACHAAIRVYRQLGSHLYKGPEHMRTAFFQNIGYLLVSWREYVSDNDQKDLIMGFDEERDESSLDLDGIPFTDTCSITQTTEEMMHTQAKNKKLMKALFSSFPGLILHVKHDVHVTSGGGAQRRHSGGKKRSIKRLINLIEVASDVLVEYSRIVNIDMFLSRHKTLLKSVMIFAFLIKKLVVKFIEMREDVPSEFPKAQNIVVHDTCLKDFLPGATIQETYINSRCLRFDEKVYATLNVPDEDEDGEQIEAVGNFSDENRIM